MDTQNSDGKKNIQINIFESMQVDFNPEKPKRRRRVDDYDYNDPFLERFEGEFDAVELECKLENFFIYKGKIIEDPKRIARKYNNSLKKQKLFDKMQNNDQEIIEDPSKILQFEFEKKLIKSTNQNCKYRKDLKFDNALLWVMFVRNTSSEFERYLRYKVIYAFKQEGYVPTLDCSPISEDNSFDVEFKSLHSRIELCFKNFMECAACSKNFSADMKNFEKLKDELFVEEMIDFALMYVAFYVCKTERNVKHVKNLAIEYLSTMLPEKCTNKIKIKHYILKNISLRVESSGYDLEKVLAGEFMLKEDNSKTSMIMKNNDRGTETKNKNTPISSKSINNPKNLEVFVKSTNNSPTAKFSGKTKNNTEKAIKKIKKVASKIPQAFGILKSQRSNPSTEHNNLADSASNHEGASSTNTFEPSFNENSVSIGTDLNPSSNSINLLSGSGSSLFLDTSIKEKKNKQYFPPIFPVFSTSFLNTKHLKPGNSEKNKKTVVIESSLDNTASDAGNELKESLEYVNPTHSIEENIVYNVNNSDDRLEKVSEYINPTQLSNYKLSNYTVGDDLHKDRDNTSKVINQSFDMNSNTCISTNLPVFPGSEPVKSDDIHKNTFDAPENNALTLSANLNSTVIDDSNQDEDNHLTFNSS